jgi:hypothetical protein
LNGLEGFKILHLENNVGESCLIYPDDSGVTIEAGPNVWGGIKMLCLKTTTFYKIDSCFWAPASEVAVGASGY